MDKNEPPRGKPRGIIPDRFRSAPRLVRVIRVICEICGLNYLYIPCESVSLLKKERIMSDIFYRTLKSISLSALILIVIGVSYMDSQAKDASLAKATFYVY